jgi:mannose-6-phosphate isomerase-like protein (cupin superfamily)
MPRDGQVLEGPDGFRLRLLETGGEVLRMEASYSGEAGMPPEHLHPNQDERFEVIEGSMRAIIGGEERTYGPGEPFEVPAGVPHQMAAEGPTRMSWEVTPPLRTAEFFERLYAAIAAENWSDVGTIIGEFGDEFRLTEGSGD